MDVMEAIFTRHSVSSVRPDLVPQELVENLLSAAVQAPNHHRVRPWRFIILAGKARERLGEVMAQSRKNQAPDTPEAVLDVERARPLRAPLIIAVGVDKPSDEKVIEIENVCAAAAAAQNLLLAAHALGLAARWRTGSAAYDPQVKAFLRLEPDQHLIGFLYLGYPVGEQTPYERPSFHDRSVWLT